MENSLACEGSQNHPKQANISICSEREFVLEKSDNQEVIMQQKSSSGALILDCWGSSQGPHNDTNIC